MFNQGALRSVSHRNHGGTSSFCEWMAREVGVAAVPGSSFFAEPVNRYVRFHFAKRVETLAEAGRRLRTMRDTWTARSATA